MVAYFRYLKSMHFKALEEYTKNGKKHLDMR